MQLFNSLHKTFIILAMLVILFLFYFVDCTTLFSSEAEMEYRVKRADSSETSKKDFGLFYKSFAIISIALFLISFIFLIGVIFGAFCPRRVKEKTEGYKFENIPATSRGSEGINPLNNKYSSIVGEVFLISLNFSSFFVDVRQTFVPLLTKKRKIKINLKIFQNSNLLFVLILDIWSKGHLVIMWLS
ncbi:hypothetical protein Mgra_00005119 [Meloidogyne graminicola]|uniref:Uncharacterized protein n=1 Tax=Meloidogyne graminicola TaxID=189291 RepID=A0A8S9ZQI9_9BILA|nr:hypothetical protein Mgra_00005119 [Meloidogyne graminicola]